MTDERQPDPGERTPDQIQVIALRQQLEGVADWLEMELTQDQRRAIAVGLRTLLKITRPDWLDAPVSTDEVSGSGRIG